MRTATLLLATLAALPAACSSPQPAPVQMESLPLLVTLFEDQVPTPIDIPNFTILSEDVGGGGAITAEQVAALPGQGYATIINLQFERESGVKAEAAAARRAGLHYVSIPMGGRDFTLEDAHLAWSAVQQAPGNVLLHCRSGGRVSALWALMRAIDEGLSPEEAMDVAANEGCRPIPDSMVRRVGEQLLP